MASSDVPEEPLVPPVLDAAELIGNSSADFPVIEAEPEEELNLPLDTAEQQRILLAVYPLLCVFLIF